MNVHIHRRERIVLAVLALILCSASAVCPTARADRLYAQWTASPLTLNGRFDGKWADSHAALRLSQGWLFARNDGRHLYFLVDLTGDTADDNRRGGQGHGDWLAISVDVNGDRRITPDIDRYYGLMRDREALGVQFFRGPGRFSPVRSTTAAVATGFGASPLTANRHRVWEVAIPLDEIAAAPGGTVAFGIQTTSLRPRFSDALPADHARDFQQLTALHLAAAPTAVGVVRPLRAGRRPAALPPLRRIEVRPLLAPGQNGLPAGTPTPCDEPQGPPTARVILPDGTVELRYADGSRKQSINGHWKFFCPDGTPVNTMYPMSNILHTFPPTLPDQEERLWLEAHSQRLLDIMAAIVNDEKMIENYLESEPEDYNVYQQIAVRRDTINYLLVE